MVVCGISCSYTTANNSIISTIENKSYIKTNKHEKDLTLEKIEKIKLMEKEISKIKLFIINYNHNLIWIYSKLSYYDTIIMNSKHRDFIIAQLLYNFDLKIKKTVNLSRKTRLQFIQSYIKILSLNYEI